MCSRKSVGREIVLTGVVDGVGYVFNDGKATRYVARYICSKLYILGDFMDVKPIFFFQILALIGLVWNSFLIGISYNMLVNDISLKKGIVQRSILTSVLFFMVAYPLYK